MPFTNAQKQARWRDRNMIVLSASAEQIASKLTATDGLDKLHKLAALLNQHLKDRPCPTCNGKGVSRLQTSPPCNGRRAKNKPPAVSPPFPCPTCRPAEYFVASGGELRAQGRYVEAIQAASEIWNYWSVGDTLIAWGVPLKEAQAALGKAGFHISRNDLAYARDHALRIAPQDRTLSLSY
jgi:hypothetical protein